MKIPYLPNGNKISDPMFGDLKRNRMSSQHFWQGTVMFAPTNSPIAIYIFDLADGVSEAHYNFFMALEANFESFRKKAGVLLQEAYVESIGPLNKEDIWSEFKVSSVTFPSETELLSGSFKWDLHLSHDSQKPDFLIEMENWEPVMCYSGE